MCAYWSNEQGMDKEIDISAFDIDNTFFKISVVKEIDNSEVS